MRKPAKSSSTLLHPLDLILGSIGAVRILRELVLHGDILSAKILSERTKLNRRGVTEILARLSAAGIIENIPSAGSTSFKFSQKHFLADKLTDLFQSEAKRPPSLFRSLKNVAKKYADNLQAIWLFGSAARASDGTASDVDIAFVFSSPPSKTTSEALTEALQALSRETNLSLSPAIMTTGDLNKLKTRNARFRSDLVRDGIPVFGPSPMELLNG